MNDYSPKRRTALVFTGSVLSGPYHAGALKALDESDEKIDLIVGSGAGAVAAAYGAVAGGARLYDAGGFWPGAEWESFYRLKTPLRLALLLLGVSFGVFLLPVALALVGRPLVPLALTPAPAVPGENLGQPGFRELILRTADLETGTMLPFVILEDAHRDAFTAARTRGPRSRLAGIPGAIDLRAEGCDTLLLDAVLTGLQPTMVAPVQRVAFPKGGLYAGEVHRLTDAALAAGSGIAEALAAGAEQVIVVSAAPVVASPSARRRGPRALADAVLSTLERQIVDEDVRAAERINRMVETLGHG